MFQSLTLNVLLKSLFDSLNLGGAEYHQLPVNFPGRFALWRLSMGEESGQTVVIVLAG